MRNTNRRRIPVYVRATCAGIQTEAGEMITEPSARCRSCLYVRNERKIRGLSITQLSHLVGATWSDIALIEAENYERWDDRHTAALERIEAWFRENQKE
jgi:hypothetical protein